MRCRLRAAVLLLALAALSACAGGGDGPVAAAEDREEPVAADGRNALEVLGTDQLSFQPEALTTAAGEVTVELTTEQVVHDFVIEELDDLRVVQAQAGETNTGTVELEPGTYTFYCSVPGHRAAGMEGVLTVE